MVQKTTVLLLYLSHILSVNNYPTNEPCTS